MNPNNIPNNLPSFDQVVNTIKGRVIDKEKFIKEKGKLHIEVEENKKRTVSGDKYISKDGKEIIVIDKEKIIVYKSNTTPINIQNNTIDTNGVSVFTLDTKEQRCSFSFKNEQIKLEMDSRGGKIDKNGFII